VPLLRHIARKGKPMIVSTGARFSTSLSRWTSFRGAGNDQIVLLQ